MRKKIIKRVERDSLCSVRVNKKLLNSVLKRINSSGLNRFVLGFSDKHSVNASDLLEMLLFLFETNKDPYSLLFNARQKYYDNLNGIDKQLRLYLDALKFEKGGAFVENNLESIIREYKRTHR